MLLLLVCSAVVPLPLYQKLNEFGEDSDSDSDDDEDDGEDEEEEDSDSEYDSDEEDDEEEGKEEDEGSAVSEVRVVSSHHGRQLHPLPPTTGGSGCGKEREDWYDL